MVLHPTKLAILCLLTGCGSIHPSHTLPDAMVTINHCTYEAHRIQDSRTGYHWKLTHDTACVHTLYHLKHPIYVDSLQPMTITKGKP